jgi:hypothetical protein
MPYPQTQEHETIPFYIPVQPLTNSCSHCFPASSTLQVAFYTYPCGKLHLSHESCFKTYVRSQLWERGCIYCVKEFGIPLPAAEVEVQEHQRVIKCGLIGYLLLFLVIIVGAIFLTGFQQRWW